MRLRECSCTVCVPSLISLLPAALGFRCGSVAKRFSSELTYTLHPQTHLPGPAWQRREKRIPTRLCWSFQFSHDCQKPGESAFAHVDSWLGTWLVWL